MASCGILAGAVFVDTLTSIGNAAVEGAMMTSTGSGAVEVNVMLDFGDHHVGEF